MILPDWEIAELCGDFEAPLISPFIREHLQPASVDLTLADDVRMPRLQDQPLGVYQPLVEIDLADFHSDDHFHPNEEIGEDGFKLWPGYFVLGRTVERIQIPNDLVGRIEGKSSLGRIGLGVHITAGFADPGFAGTVTLELVNLNHTRPIILRPGKRICQISFTRLSAEAARPYGSDGLGSHYQDQYVTTPSRYTEP